MITWSNKHHRIGPSIYEGRLGAFVVANVTFALVQKNDPTVYRWVILLPGMKEEYRSGTKPTVEEAQHRAEVIVREWVKLAGLKS
jgi:hypothetical protein